MQSATGYENGREHSARANDVSMNANGLSGAGKVTPCCSADWGRTSDSVDNLWVDNGNGVWLNLKS
jgi:hypothetical protein